MLVWSIDLINTSLLYNRNYLILLFNLDIFINYQYAKILKSELKKKNHFKILKQNNNVNPIKLG
jgi:hypothetical protein